MANFPVQIVNHTVPAVAVSIAGELTYGEFKNSLGNYVYHVYQVYLQTQTLTQLNTPYQYSAFDANGNKNIYIIKPNADPYQRILALLVDLKKMPAPVILNGNNNVFFNLIANATVQIMMFSFVVTNQLDMYGANFLAMKKQSGGLIPEFFNEYTNYVK